MPLQNIRCGNNMNELYFTFKIIHVITGSILFTSIFVLGGYTLCQRQLTTKLLTFTRNISWLVSLPMLLLQMITGFTIISIKPYSIYLPWVWGTFIGFAVLTICWLGGTFFLTLAIAEPEPREQHFRRWQYSLYISFATLLVMLFFMSSAS